MTIKNEQPEDVKSVDVAMTRFNYETITAEQIQKILDTPKFQSFFEKMKVRTHVRQVQRAMKRHDFVYKKIDQFPFLSYIVLAIVREHWEHLENHEEDIFYKTPFTPYWAINPDGTDA
jgi:hypothetical protein